MQKISSLIVSLIIGLVIGSALSSALYSTCHSSMDRTIVKSDTTIVIDTNLYMNPLPVNVEINITDTIEVPVSNIILISDSLMALPKTIKTFEDEGYKMQISGYDPVLDWIEVYPSTKFIESESLVRKPARRWGIGIQAGYGLLLNSRQVTHGVYLGLGISYNLL